MSENEKKVKTKRGFKIILIIILILLLLFLVHTIKNFVIINNLQNKIAQYTDSKNYHITLDSKLKDGISLTMNHYKKDNKEVIFLERNKNDEIVKMSVYNNGERIDTFVESSNLKTVTLNSANSLNADIMDFLKTDNIWQNFIYSVPSRIKNVNYNEKKCYSIKNFLSPYYLYDYDANNNELYIEKDTGLCLKSNTSDSQAEYKYEFNNVNDSIFVEPDIGEYTLKENN